MRMYRQGDVLLVETTANPPANAVKYKNDGRGVVLAEGESTDHYHGMTAKSTDAWVLPDAERMYLSVSETTELVHQDHDTIQVAPGTYWVVYQHEYSPEAIRRVLD